MSVPVLAAVAPAGATLSQEAAKAIGSKMRAGVVMKLGKRVTKKNVELAQFGNAAPTGGWNVVPPAPGPTPGVGVGGVGGVGGGVGATGAVGVGAGTVAGGIGVGAAAAAAGAAAAVAGGVAVASSSGGSNPPIISVSP
ncbi:hypothetical protein [Rhizorhabdus phycosphaerae]|uniref:hypothetical protein n=1 Tax=Rhizorhabdus phycosphaerae TaxID=2711156 RepID=UPI0013ED90D5|nr:hypothetical protein [Rhizorhabdus phycosphaerae]